MAAVKPMTTATLDPPASPPPGTIANPGAGRATPPTADQRATEEQELRAQLYGYRREADPIVYDRVVAFHPHAATSAEALATFKADLDRATAEAQAKIDAIMPPPPEGGEGGEGSAAR